MIESGSKGMFLVIIIHVNNATKPSNKRLSLDNILITSVYFKLMVMTLLRRCLVVLGFMKIFICSEVMDQ